MKFGQQVRIKNHSQFLDGQEGVVVSQNIYCEEKDKSEVTYDVKLAHETIYEVTGDKIEKL